jgi:hypothetical protein
MVTNHFVRGAVSGLGVVNLIAALAELLDLVGGPRSKESVSDATLSLEDPHAR